MCNVQCVSFYQEFPFNHILFFKSRSKFEKYEPLRIISILALDFFTLFSRSIFLYTSRPAATNQLQRRNFLILWQKRKRQTQSSDKESGHWSLNQFLISLKQRVFSSLVFSRIGYEKFDQIVLLISKTAFFKTTAVKFVLILVFFQRFRTSLLIQKLNLKIFLVCRSLGNRNA